MYLGHAIRPYGLVEKILSFNHELSMNNLLVDLLTYFYIKF